MIMFFLGEVTSPLLNAFTFMGTLRQRSRTCFKLYEYLSPSFTGVCQRVVELSGLVQKWGVLLEPTAGVGVGASSVASFPRRVDGCRVPTSSSPPKINKYTQPPLS